MPANPQKENGYTAIANEIMEALGKTRISGEARQMLDTILRKTYGWNKKEDKISTSQFMQLTGLSRRSVYKGRRKLISMNLITISLLGDSQILTYSFQKDYNKWRLSPKKALSPKKEIGISQKGHKLSPKKRPTITTTKAFLINNTTIVARDYFYSSYKQAFGKEYIADFGKDGKIFKDLLAVIPLEELKTLIDRFFASRDKFIKDSGYTIGVFKNQINKLRQSITKPVEGPAGRTFD